MIKKSIDSPWIAMAFFGLTAWVGAPFGAWAQQLEKSSPAGRGIYEAVISDEDGHIYVSGAGSRANPGGALYKIDSVTLALVDSIPLREHPPYGIGINNRTQMAYTSNTLSNSVSVVDLRTG